MCMDIIQTLNIEDKNSCSYSYCKVYSYNENDDNIITYNICKIIDSHNIS